MFRLDLDKMISVLAKLVKADYGNQLLPTRSTQISVDKVWKV